MNENRLASNCIKKGKTYQNVINWRETTLWVISGEVSARMIPNRKKKEQTGVKYVNGTADDLYKHDLSAFFYIYRSQYLAGTCTLKQWSYYYHLSTKLSSKFNTKIRKSELWFFSGSYGFLRNMFDKKVTNYKISARW